MDYITITDSKVSGHYCASKKPDKEGVIEAPLFNAYVGVPLDYLDDNYRIKSEEVLISEGIIKDNRGVYYDSGKQEHRINMPGIDPKPTWTTEIWNHITDVLNHETLKWEADNEAMTEHEDSLLRKNRKSEFILFDKYQLPLLWAELTEGQKTEYTQWRSSWLNVPETRIPPERPEWFDE